MTADCVFHPENLKPGGWYTFHFASAHKTDASSYTLRAKFVRLGVGINEVQTETEVKRLRVILKVPGERICRKLSWNRIKRIEPED